MLKVVIAEDEPIVADLLECALLSKGYDVCGIARSADQAVALVERHEPDLAVIDVRIARDDSAPDIARRLGNPQNLGILYVTGSDEGYGTLSADDGAAAISKPYLEDDIVRALEIVWEISKAGSATPPFPPGFRVLTQKVSLRSALFQT
jgi:CheY-like chemotaxis protein